MNWKDIIIAALACGVVGQFAVIGVLIWRRAKGTTFVGSPVRASLVAEVQTAADKPCATIEEVNRKYEGMAETDPITAGRLKYQELLRFHGK